MEVLGDQMNAAQKAQDLASQHNTEHIVGAMGEAAPAHQGHADTMNKVPSVCNHFCLGFDIY